MSGIQIVENSSGLVMALGAHFRPHDPSEDKYAARNTFRPTASADLSKSSFIPGVGTASDPRIPVTNQGGQGSCAAFGTASAVTVARNVLRVKEDKPADSPQFHYGSLYEQMRRKRGWFPLDSGSYPVDGLDFLLIDGPLLSSYPYIADPALAYPDSVWNDGKVTDYEASHSALYPPEQGFLETLWLAFAAGYTAVMTSYWPTPFFYPVNGLLPSGVSHSSNDSAHCWYAYGYIPGKGIAGANSWTPGWSADASLLHPFMRPGEFCFNLEYLSTMLGEVRLVRPEALPIDPEPVPDPSARPTIVETWQKKHKLKAVVLCKDTHPDATLWYNGVKSVAGFMEDRFVLRLEVGRYQLKVVNPNGLESAPALLNIVQPE